MDLRQLRYFVGIVQTGSLSRAADQLHVAQSAISHQLARLESELGRELVTRGSKGVVLTEAGSVLYRHAEAILRHVESAKQDAMIALDVPSGRVSIGFPNILAPLLGYELFNQVRDRFPEILLNVSGVDSWLLRERLINGRLDMALLFTDHPERGLAVEPLVEEELFYVTADPDPSPITVDAAAQSALLLPDPAGSAWQVAEKAFRKKGLEFTPVGEISEVRTLRRAVAFGLGNTIQPWSLLYDADNRPALNYRRFADAKLVRPVSLCFPEVGQRNPAIEAVAVVLKSLVRDLVENGTWQGVSLIDVRAGELSQSAGPPLTPLEIEG